MDKTKPKKSYRVKGTMRQRLAIAKLAESGGVVGTAMRKAGYAVVSSLTPQKLTESKAFKQELPDIIEQLKIERQRAVDHMAKKIGKAKYRDMVEALDKTTKNIQLLSGGNTEKGELTFKWQGAEKPEPDRKQIEGESEEMPVKSE